MHSSASGADVVFKSVPTLKGQRAITSLSRSAQWRLFIISLIANDVLMVALAFRLAFFVRFELALPVFRLDVTPVQSFYGSLALFLVPTWFVIFILSGLYHGQNLLGGTQEYSLVFRAITIGMLLVILAGFLEPFFIFARGWLLLAWLFAFLTVSSGRFALRRVVYFLRQRGYFLTPAIIVGANEEGRLLAEQLLLWRTSGLYIVGFIDVENELTPGTACLRHLQVLGNLEHLEEIISRCGVEEVIIATSAVSREQTLEVFKRYGVSDQVNLRLSSGLFEIITTGLEVKEVASVPLVRVNKVRLTGLEEFVKLVLDYTLAIPGLVLILPLYLLIAIAVKLDSPGPVFHRRRVMGMNGRQFDAFKFRTMYVNGDEILTAHPELQAELARNHKLKADPRITRIGSLLRKSSLDELPQLLNVLKRDMSLVGPRIISPEEMEKYDQWGINLLTVRPGITGLWQVSGRSDISYEGRVRLDMYYIRNWTIWLDLHLLLQTIPAVAKSRGAY